MVEWTKENVKNLIKCYEDHPELWDSKCEQFKMKVQKEATWTALAEKFNTTTYEVQRKMHNLRNQFNNEYKKTQTKTSTDGTDECYISRWMYFPHMLFLRNSMLKKTASRNCQNEEKFYADDSSLAHDGLQDSSRDLESSENDELPDRKIRRTDGDDTVLQDALHCMKTILDTSERRDEHSIYGEHIAHKIRTCNRNNSEITIAQHHIENIIFNLSTGVYSEVAAAGDATIGKNNIEVLQVYIPKMEPDL